MDPFQGITAEIISNGQVLEIYDNPDAAEAKDSHARHHYVEAVAGSTFVVKVDLTPQFKFYEMKSKHAVKVRIRIDGNEHAVWQTITKKSLQEKFSQGEPGTLTFSSPRHFCKETGQWMRSDYSFGNLVLNDIPDSDISFEQAQDLGTIEIIVQRVKLKKREVPHVSKGASIKPINEVAEKALKGRPIETTVRLVNARPASKRHDQTEKTRPISGKAGDPVVFNIHYRSRRALQMLGCIPRSPSPTIDAPDDEPAESIIRPESNPSTTYSSNNQSQTSMTSSASSSDELLRQVQFLTARITELERANIKTEAANTGTLIKNEETSVKREREEDDSQNDTRQRRRIAVKIEHVDLTDD